MIIKIFQALLRSVRLIFNPARFLSKYLYQIFKIVKKLAASSVALVVVSFYPILELILHLIFGWKGLISPIINSFIEKIFNKALTFISGNIDMSSSYNEAVSMSFSFVQWLGVSKAVVTLMNGLVSASVLFVTVKISIYLIRIKVSVYTRIMKTRGGYL